MPSEVGQVATFTPDWEACEGCAHWEDGDCLKAGAYRLRVVKREGVKYLLEPEYVVVCEDYRGAG